MQRNYNVMYYTNDQVKKGMLGDLIKFLTNENLVNGEDHNDIHISYDGCTTSIEWTQVPYNFDGDGKFEFVNSDEVVMKEVWFPDNHCEYLSTDEDPEQAIKEWADANGYVKNDFGRYVDKTEFERFNYEG